MSLYLPCAWYVLEICVTKASISKQVSRTSFMVYTLSALHSFVFKIHLQLNIHPFQETLMVL